MLPTTVSLIMSSEQYIIKETRRTISCKGALLYGRIQFLGFPPTAKARALVEANRVEETRAYKTVNGRRSLILGRSRRLQAQLRWQTQTSHCGSGRNGPNIITRRRPKRRKFASSRMNDERTTTTSGGGARFYSAPGMGKSPADQEREGKVGWVDRTNCGVDVVQGIK